MIKNKPLAIISFFLIVSILIAIYSQCMLVERIYSDRKIERDYSFMEDLEHSFFLTEEKKESVKFDHEDYHAIINSYVIKSSDYAYEMDKIEFEEFIESIKNDDNASMFDIKESDSTDIEHFLKSRVDDRKFKINYSIERFYNMSYEKYKEIYENSDLIICYSFATYKIDFKDNSSLFSSEMIKIILSSLFFIITIIFCGALLIKKYLNEKKLSLYKNEFINNLTHELQTPLTVSKLALEKLKIDLEDNKALNKYVAIAEKENSKIEKLTKRILKLAELKTVISKKEKINVSDSIKEIVNRYESIITKEDVLLTDLNHSELKLRGNKERFLDLLDNLLSNAIKYSKSPKQIVLKTNSKNEKFYLSVEDNGIGIPEEFEDKIFSPFFKVPNNDTHEVKSHGLGLSYVAEIVKQMNGQISMSSELNRGTTFTIILPYEN